MENVFNFIVKLHVMVGALALVVGLMAMLNKTKGNRFHRVTGKVFFHCMNFIFVTAIIFVLLKPHMSRYYFFLAIGIVSFYPNFSGYRLLKMKKEIKGMWYDYAAVVLIGLSGIVMLIFGAGSVLGLFQKDQFKILYLIFGAFSLFQCYGDGLLFLGKKTPEKLHWLYGHIGKMIGSYSAALTAFCVNIVPRYLPQNSPTFYYLLLWIGPGVLLAIYSARQIKKRKQLVKA